MSKRAENSHSYPSQAAIRSTGRSIPIIIISTSPRCGTKAGRAVGNCVKHRHHDRGQGEGGNPSGNWITAVPWLSRLDKQAFRLEKSTDKSCPPPYDFCSTKYGGVVCRLDATQHGNLTPSLRSLGHCCLKPVGPTANSIQPPVLMVVAGEKTNEFGKSTIATRFVVPTPNNTQNSTRQEKAPRSLAGKRSDHDSLTLTKSPKSTRPSSSADSINVKRWLAKVFRGHSQYSKKAPISIVPAKHSHHRGMYQSS